MAEVVDRVDLRVHNVDVVELSQLTTSVDKLENLRFEENVVQTNEGDQEFILTVKPATVQQIKDALRVMLRVVTPERIYIDT